MIDWSKLVLGPTEKIFGEPVRYEPAYGRPTHIRGVFDEAYIELTPLGKGGIDTESFSLGAPGAISSEMPVLGVRLDHFLQMPQQGDALVIRGEKYVIKEVRPDGHGWAKLLLNVV